MPETNYHVRTSDSPKNSLSNRSSMDREPKRSSLDREPKRQSSISSRSSYGEDGSFSMVPPSHELPPSLPKLPKNLQDRITVCLLVGLYYIDSR